MTDRLVPSRREEVRRGLSAIIGKLAAIELKVAADPDLIDAFDLVGEARAAAERAAKAVD